MSTSGTPRGGAGNVVQFPGSAAEAARRLALARARSTLERITGRRDLPEEIIAAVARYQSAIDKSSALTHTDGSGSL
jgi:hypothetical protein